MSLLDRLLPPLPRTDLSPFQPQIEPWTDDSHLWDVQLPYDLLGTVPRVTDRRQAMSVPAVARARHLTAGTIAALPLLVMSGADLAPVQPSWCEGTDGQTGDLTAPDSARLQIPPQSPWSRLLWTVDDLLFYGSCLWAATRVDADGRPSRLARVKYGAWTQDQDTGAVSDADGRAYPCPVVLIEGPHEGILRFGADTISTAAELERVAAENARTPFRLELHQTNAAEMDPAERAELVAQTRKALYTNRGILFTNSAIETKTHSLDASETLTAARNAASLDVARHVSMPAAMIDATTAGASLEYATLTGRNQHWLDYGLSLYLNAVTARLSMDDVLPRGQRTVLDTSALTALDAPDTGPTRQD